MVKICFKSRTLATLIHDASKTHERFRPCIRLQTRRSWLSAHSALTKQAGHTAKWKDQVEPQKDFGPFNITKATYTVTLPNGEMITKCLSVPMSKHRLWQLRAPDGTTQRAPSITWILWVTDVTCTEMLIPNLVNDGHIVSLQNMFTVYSMRVATTVTFWKVRCSTIRISQLKVVWGSDHTCPEMASRALAWASKTCRTTEFAACNTINSLYYFLRFFMFHQCLSSDLKQ